VSWRDELLHLTRQFHLTSMESTMYTITKSLVKMILFLRAEGLTYREINDELAHLGLESGTPTSSYRLMKRADARYWAMVV
jgi:hypothetical protein